MQEKIIETKICKQCEKNFNIYDLDIEYLDKLSPIIAGKKYSLPTPKMCPDCRKIQRLAWRNERNLFRRKCDFSGKDIIAVFPPDMGTIIYDDEIWYSDKHDGKKYGKEFDFSKTFFEQFAELFHSVPIISRSVVKCENSDYCNGASYVKNCYLCFNAGYSEDVYYSNDISYVNNSVDCYNILYSENCYECIVCINCYNTQHSFDVKNCRDSKFLLSCDGCKDCYGCFDLLNCQYYIYNEKYSKEEYLEKMKEINIIPLSEQKKKFEEFYKDKYEKKPLPNTGSENIIDSDNALDSENVSHSKNIRNGKNIRYSQIIQKGLNNLCMDYTSYGLNAEKVYFSQQIGEDVFGVYFCVSTFENIRDVFYSAFCIGNIKNCFGCVGLKNSSYCILNKQYTKEEYEELVPKIIEHMQKTGEWGQFFPGILSPCGYNYSSAKYLENISKEEALKKGFNWSDYESPLPKVSKTIKAELLPEDISKIPDDVLNRAIICEKSGKPFLIIEQELEFYRKHSLPIPRLHSDERHKERLKWYVNY